jgi:hypothetical protein
LEVEGGRWTEEVGAENESEGNDCRPLFIAVPVLGTLSLFAQTHYASPSAALYASSPRSLRPLYIAVDGTVSPWVPVFFVFFYVFVGTE